MKRSDFIKTAIISVSVSLVVSSCGSWWDASYDSGYYYDPVAPPPPRVEPLPPVAPPPSKPNPSRPDNNPGHPDNRPGQKPDNSPNVSPDNRPGGNRPGARPSGGTNVPNNNGKRPGANVRR